MIGAFFGCGFAALCLFAAKFPWSECPDMNAAKRHFEALWYRGPTPSFTEPERSNDFAMHFSST
jgi:hypothetical protein